jgi:hypothetical protein
MQYLLLVKLSHFFLYLRHAIFFTHFKFLSSLPFKVSHLKYLEVLSIIKIDLSLTQILRFIYILYYSNHGGTGAVMV